MRYTISALALVACLLQGCTYQQIQSFNAVVNGINAGIASAQRERALRAYEASVYNPQPQTVVVVHTEGR